VRSELYSGLVEPGLEGSLPSAISLEDCSLAYAIILASNSRCFIFFKAALVGAFFYLLETVLYLSFY
jgi:hypothetical protein